MPLPVLLIPLLFVPAAAASMHARELERCRSCGSGSRCDCSTTSFVSLSATTVVQPLGQLDARTPPSRMNEALDQELELKVQTLEAAGLPVPDVAVSKLTDAEIQAYLDAARLKGVIDQAIPVLLVMGVPPEAIFLTKYAIRYRYWLSPTVFDFLPERWQLAIDGAVGSDWSTDRELAASFLVRLGFSEENAFRVLDAITRGRGEAKDMVEEVFGAQVHARRGPRTWNRDQVRADLLDRPPGLYRR